MIRPVPKPLLSPESLQTNSFKRQGGRCFLNGFSQKNIKSRKRQKNCVSRFWNKSIDSTKGVDYNIHTFCICTFLIGVCDQSLCLALAPAE